MKNQDFPVTKISYSVKMRFLSFTCEDITHKMQMWYYHICSVFKLKLTFKLKLRCQGVFSFFFRSYNFSNFLPVSPQWKEEKIATVFVGCGKRQETVIERKTNEKLIRPSEENWEGTIYSFVVTHFPAWAFAILIETIAKNLVHTFRQTFWNLIVIIFLELKNNKRSLAKYRSLKFAKFWSNCDK